MTSSIFSFRPLWVALALAAPFLLAEAVMRVHYFGADALLNPGDYSAAGPLEHGLFALSPDPSLAWTLKPDLDTRFKGAKFNTNSAGFRGPEYRMEKAAGVTRILIPGRSITMGAGVANDETWTVRLQAKLDEHAPGRFEVMNLAVAGYELPQMFTTYEMAKEYSPDVVIIPMTTGTFKRRIAPIPTLWKEPPWSELKGLLGRCFIYDAMRKAMGDWMRRNLSSDWRERSAAGLPAAKSVEPRVLLERFIRARLQEDIPVIIVMLKTHWDFTGPYQEQVVIEARRWVNGFSNASLIDTTGPLKGRMKDTDYIYYGDEHPNAVAHELYARIIAAALPPILRRHGLSER